MKTFMTEPKAKQIYGPVQVPDNYSQAAPMPTHGEIATRAYDIYVKQGCRQGQCERNWQQAENDLRIERKNLKTSCNR